MLESVIFIFLILLGVLILIISLPLLVVGFVKKSRKLKIIALFLLTIPISCLLILAGWYGFAKPHFDSNEMASYSGVYLTANSQDELELYPDGSYEITFPNILNLSSEGTWEAGGIDGTLKFYDNNGNLKNWASPVQGDINFTFSDSEETLFIKE